jgi:hypothetical protein
MAADGSASRRSCCEPVVAAGPALTEVAAPTTDAERIVPHAVSSDFAEAADLQASPDSAVAEMLAVALRWKDAAQPLSTRTRVVLDAGSKAR